MKDVALLLYRQGRNGRESEKTIRGMVRFALAELINKPPPEINADTAIPAEHVEAILEHVGNEISKVIPKPRKPRHGFKVSTLTGYISKGQDGFAKREPPPAQS